MKTGIYFCDIENFGDALNKYIFKDLDITYKNVKKAAIMGIGSLLENLLVDNKGYPNINLPIKIFSSGFGFEKGGFFHNKNIIFPEKFKRNVEIYAVRGCKSLERLRTITKNYDKDIVLGDGGLLSNTLIDNINIQKKYKLGIVPHYAEMNDDIFDIIKTKIKDSTILNPISDPIVFLKSLIECETVISTAMHPLIACDAFHIPNLWIRISDLTTSFYKFLDYYSVFNLQPTPINPKKDHEIINNNLPDYIKRKYVISAKNVEEIQKNLLQSKQRLKDDIKFYNTKYYTSKLLPFKKIQIGDYRKFYFCGFPI